MRKYTNKRAGSFLSHLIRLTHRLKLTFTFMARIAQDLPMLKPNVDKILTEPLANFIYCVETYFNVGISLDLDTSSSIEKEDKIRKPA